MTPSLNSIGTKIVDNWKLAVIAVLVLAMGGLYMKLEATERELGKERLAHENAVARADSTTEELQELDSRYRFFRRLSQQYKIERDSIDRKLDQESQARAQLAVQVRELRADSAIADTAYIEGDTRVAEFSRRLEHGLLTTKVRVPPAPAPPELRDIRFQLDPIMLEARIACIQKDNVRAASLTVRTPNWATVRVDSVVTEPRVCNPDLLNGNGSQTMWVGTTAIGTLSGATSGYVIGNGDPVDAVIGGVAGGGVGYLTGKIWEIFR